MFGILRFFFSDIEENSNAIVMLLKLRIY